MRDSVLRSLYQKVGEVASLHGEGDSASFGVQQTWGGGTCRAEGVLEYRLPNGGSLTHKNDILVTLANSARVAVEIKFLSNVTDQFKCRSYDALHLKQTFGDGILTVLVYVRPPSAGLTIRRAQAIAYPFDRFVGVEIRGSDNAVELTSAIERIATELSELLRSVAQKKIADG